MSSTENNGPDKDKKVIQLRSKTIRRGEMTQQPEEDDESWGLSGGNAIVVPDNDPSDLLRVVKCSSILPQCIRCYVTNIYGFGYKIVPITTKEEVDPKEEQILKDFIKYPNPDNSLIMENKKLGMDRYSIGYGGYEVMRSSDGTLSAIRQMPSEKIRMLRFSDDDKPIMVERTIIRAGKPFKFKELKRFRRYVWEKEDNTHVYFKEYGDPRTMSHKTGLFGSRTNKIKKSEQATEYLMFKEYGSSYGDPIWLSQAPGVLGSREAEEMNQRYFKNNTIPNGLLSVAGGSFSAESIEKLEKAFNKQAMEAEHYIHIVEAFADQVYTEGSSSSVKIEFIPLAGQRPTDGLFSEYDKNNQNKARSAFRLPPVLIGLSEDVTFATANTSLVVAEGQVFHPERKENDEFINRRIINNVDYGLGLKTVKLESLGPDLTNPENIVKALTALNVMGAITPRKVIDFMAENLNMLLEQYPEKGEEGYQEWMDMPIQLSVKEGSHADGSVKDPKIDEAEGGDIGMDVPEHGQE